MKKLFALFLLLIGTVAHAGPKINIADINGFNAAVNALIASAGYVPTTRTLTAGTGLTGGGDLSANRTFALDLTRANTWTGAITAPGFVGPLTGNVTGTASQATILQTARTIGTVTGDATSAGSTFSGAANNTNALTLATVNSNVGTCGSSTTVPVVTLNAKGLTTACSATALGNAPTATALATARTIGTLTGDVTSAGSNFDGSAANTNVTVLVSTQTGTHSWTGQQTFATNAIFNDSTVGGAAPTVRLANSATATINNAVGISFDPRNAGLNQRDLQIVGRAPSVGGATQLVFRTGGGLSSVPADQWIMFGGLYYAGLSDPGVGIIAANGFVGPLTGTASLATKWATARNFPLTGDVTGTCSTDGSADCSAATTLATTQGAVHTWSGLQTLGAGLTISGGSYTQNTGNFNLNSGLFQHIVTSGNIVDSIQGNAATQLRIYRYSADASAPDMLFAKYRGSIGSIAAAVAGDAAGDVQFSVYTGTNLREAAAIRGAVTDTPTETTMGGSLSLCTTTTGTVSEVCPFSIDSGNVVQIGSVAGRSARYAAATGIPTYQFNDNSASATLGVLNNYSVTGVNQGATLGTVNLGVSATFGAIAGKAWFKTTDTWALAANRSVAFEVDTINAGTLQLNSLGFDQTAGTGLYVGGVLAMAPTPIPYGVATFTNTASFSPTIGQLKITNLVTGVQTGNITVTLPACIPGNDVRWTRAAASTGAFTVTIGGKALSTSQWADFSCSGTAFVETASGSL